MNADTHPPPLLPLLPQDLESGIRIGDVYALMVEYYYEQRNALEAYKLIEGMRRRAIILSPYLDSAMVQVGMPNRVAGVKCCG